MENLSKQSTQMLRAPTTPSMPAAMQARMAAGYSLIRYRVLTGEQCVALMRGPLVPVPNDASNFVNWPAHSNTSTAYQILDPETGIMDVSYSVAWQLGRALAIADQTFATALSRYRTACFNMAWASTKERILREQGLWRSKDDLMIDLSVAWIVSISFLIPHGLDRGPICGKGGAARSLSFVLRFHSKITEYEASICRSYRG